MSEKKVVILATCVTTAVVLGVLFWVMCLVTVPKGHVGVMSLFGDVKDETLSPGMHVVGPFKAVYRVDVRTVKNEEPAVVPTANGLSVEIKAVMLYHLKPDQAPKMAREVGVGVTSIKPADKDKAVVPDVPVYESRVVDPVFKNNVRDVCAKYPPEDLYGPDRDKIEKEIFARTQAELDARGLAVEAVMILDPVLPKEVTDRIKAKVGAEQDAQRMEFVLKQKELEAKAKVVEAEGIAKAQQIIKKDLDDNYIRYLWIEAMKAHPGAIIYVPTGADGLPFFKPVHGGK